MTRRMVAMSSWALAIAVSAGGAAMAQTVQTQVQAGGGKIGAAELVELHVTIEAIDVATREVRVRHDDGALETLVAGDDVKRLADLKPGDGVDIQVYRSLTLGLNKTTATSPTQAESSTEERTEPSELPGGMKTRQVTIVARVTAVNSDASTVTLTGPKGRSAVLPVDKEILAKIKVGDLVDAVYTEALAVSIIRVEGK